MTQLSAAYSGETLAAVAAERDLRSGADVLPLQPAGFAVGGALAVIGFLQFAMGLGHDSQFSS
jgi:hypothetical protein